MNAALCQGFVDGRFPMNPLLLRPMRVEFGNLVIPLRRQRGPPIGYRRFGVLLAVGKNADLDLVSRERCCYNYVLHAPVPKVVCCEQPKSILAPGAGGTEHHALALGAL